MISDVHSPKRGGEDVVSTNSTYDFIVTNGMTNVFANFGTNTYNVSLDSTYTNWFGTNTIGNPEATPNPVPHDGDTEVKVAEYVTNQPGRRVRFKGWKDE